jgi:hypothetical protein
METNPANGKIIPLIKLSFQRGIGSPMVRGAIAFIRGVSPEEGAVVSAVIERRQECSGRLTTIVVYSAAPFGAEETALTWWQKITSRLEKELPHRQLLVERLSQMSFSYTTPEILDLLRRRNGHSRPQPEVTQDRNPRASDMFFSDAKASERLFPPAEKPGETR